MGKTLNRTKKCGKAMIFGSAEHPFGTVKWHHDARYLLCRGLEEATGELGLSFLAYNLKRAINLVGVPALVAALT